MLIFLGFDDIRVYCNKSEIAISRQSLEWELGPKLLGIIQNNAIDHISVINGPGSFTNIRIGSLVINTIASLLGDSFQLSSIDSLSWYNFFVDGCYLPPKGYIHIGQKKKCRLYDFVSSQHKLVSLADVSHDTISFVEPISAWFGQPNSVTFDLCDNRTIRLSFAGETTDFPLEAIPFVSTPAILPAYMIEPNIHKKTSP